MKLQLANQWLTIVLGRGWTVKSQSWDSTELRDYFGTYLLNHGILEAEINLCQGRIPVDTFIRHYWSPKLKDLGNRIFKALESSILSWLSLFIEYTLTQDFSPKHHIVKMENGLSEEARIVNLKEEIKKLHSRDERWSAFTAIGVLGGVIFIAVISYLDLFPGAVPLPIWGMGVVIVAALGVLSYYKRTQCEEKIKELRNQLKDISSWGKDAGMESSLFS